MRWKSRLILCVVVLLGLRPNLALPDVFNMPNGQRSLEFATIGDPGNVADSSGYGAVGSTYRMGKYEVTTAQYTQFLNAIAKTDTYGAYNPWMGTNFPNDGVFQSGSSSNFNYWFTGTGDAPMTTMRWNDAARFCNWLQNGQPTGNQGPGTTETGAYTINSNPWNVTEPRNDGATYFIPTEDEWFKAAYYKGGGTNAGYWSYPTQSNTEPSLDLASTLPSPYGTYCQGPSPAEWTEGLISGGYRVYRGGPSSGRSYVGPYYGYPSIGFRVASSTVPEPSSIGLLLAGAVAAVAWARARIGKEKARQTRA